MAYRLDSDLSPKAHTVFELHRHARRLVMGLPVAGGPGLRVGASGAAQTN